MKLILAALALFAVTALAITPAEKAAILGDVDAVLQKYVVVPTPPQPTPWPHTSPDLLDIDLTSEASVLLSKFKDGSVGWGGGNAIHYSAMSGDLTFVNGVANYAQKFSNPSCPPRWGVEANGLHYLESCSDMTFAFPPGITGNRLINWNFGPFIARQEMYSRYMVRYDSVILKGQGNIGIKGSGIGGAGAIHVFEIGPVLAAGNWQAQDYIYDAEGAQRLEKFAFWLSPDRWYTIEQHMKMNTSPTARDGVVEWKVDGAPIGGRYDVLLSTTPGQGINGFQMQFYDGGVIPPKVLVPPPSLRARHARIALCKTTWCGPAPELP